MTKVFTKEQIKEVIKPAEVIAAIEEGFKLMAQGKVVLAPVGHLDLTNPQILTVFISSKK